MARVKRGVTSQARHKKVIKAAKGYYGRRRKILSELPNKLLNALVNMHIEIGKLESEIFARFGFNESMLHPVNTD